MTMDVFTSNSLREGLKYIVNELIPMDHAYIMNFRAGNENFTGFSATIQIVDESRIFDNLMNGLTLLLPFSQYANGREYLQRFLQLPESRDFVELSAQGYPSYALKLNSDIDKAEEIISIILVYVCGYRIHTPIECLVYDEGKVIK